MSATTNPFVEFAQGDVIFSENDRGSEMYIIESGEVQILRAAAISQPVAVLGAGDFFGEMAVLEDQPRFATATAVTKVRLLKIDRAAFAEVLRENVEISIRIMRKLANRLRRAEERLSVTNPHFAANEGPRASVPAQLPVATAPNDDAKPALATSEPKSSPKAGADPKSAKAADAKKAPAPAPMPPPAPKPEPQPAPLPASEAMVPPPPMQVTRPESMRVGLKHLSSDTVFDLSDALEFLVGRPDPVTGISPEINLGPLDGVQRSISRRHAKIVRTENGLAVREDVGTVNGTFVNGMRLKAGEPVALQVGDQVRFGLVELSLITL